MEQHKKIVHSIFTCEDCQVKFTNRKEFRNHTIMHLMDNEVETVDAVTGNKSNLSGAPAPKKLKEEPNEEYFYCDDCEFSTNTEDDYKQHVELNHVSDDQHTQTNSVESTEEPSVPLKTGGNIGTKAKSSSGEKTECSICYRNVGHLKQHMKNCHPELENIKDTALYDEILADKSMASSAASKTHGTNTTDFVTKMKEKISKDKEQAEESPKNSKKSVKDRVVRINNKEMALEECSLCHKKVLYLSDHIKEIHDDTLLKSCDGVGVAKLNIKKEDLSTDTDSGTSGEYV